MRTASAFLLLVLAAACEPLGPGPEDFQYPLAGEYLLFRSSAEQIQISPESYGSKTPIIAPKVVEVAWSDRFILAKRQALKARGGFPGDDLQVPVDGKFDFWILDTAAPKVYGPFDEPAFRARRAELGVPTGLRLKDVYADPHVPAGERSSP
jgi:hypothetical protein